MSKLIKLSIVVVMFLSYPFAFISALLVNPYLWIPIGLMMATLGLVGLYQYTYKNHGVVALAVFTNGTFISLGQYLETIVPAISILVNFIGILLSILMMVVWYYWKEGHKQVNVRIKREKVDSVPKAELSAIEKLQLFISFITRFKELVKVKKYSPLLALQFVYVEHQEKLHYKEEKNSLDFILGEEVLLERNEYDQSPDR